MRQKNIIHFKTDATGLPVITILAGIFSFLLFFSGEAISFLQYDRLAIANGEIWRCLSGHWIHWSFDHFLWCVISFVVLGCLCEGISRKGYLATIMTASFVIPAVLWVFDSNMQTYRGLSGLASSIFVFGALMMMHKAFKTKEWPMVCLSATAGLGYMAKILFEFFSGSTLFVNTHELFSPVPLAHLSGGLVGLVTALIFCEKTPHCSLNAHRPVVE
jgi:rhomboid family GlyGly-CTERM serine protease